MLSYTYIDTPLGQMIAIGNDKHIHSLKFSDKKDRKNSSTPALELLEHELDLYFNHKLTKFSSKLAPHGTEFQKKVWHTLQQIPYGTTASYKIIAENIKHPKSFRAVANANAANQILILIPCHRVIANNGNLSGFAAGVDRKGWLLAHEKYTN